MKQKLCLGLCLLGLWGGAGRLNAQVGPAIPVVDYTLDGVTINLQSQRGVPISTNNTVLYTNLPGPAGSDGLLTTVNWSGGNLPATPNQFQGLLSYGGVTAATDWLSLSNAAVSGSAPFSEAVALAMQLPIGIVGPTNYLIARRVQIGAPYLSRPISYSFGSVIPPPLTDDHGLLLPTNQLATYWQAEPWPDITNSVISTTNLADYYYSPNAVPPAVFATQPGPITITWVSSESYPADGNPNWLNYTNAIGAQLNLPSFYTNAGSIYHLYTANYVVSSGPVKPPQSLYWTEGSFSGLGYVVSLAQGRVSALHMAYNSTFPPTVAQPYQDPNSADTNAENRTLWLTSAPGIGGAQQIHAFNVQGQVFVELLGQPLAGGRASQYLGFEIVQVYQAAPSAPVTINLGEQLTPYQDGWEGVNPSPSPIDNDLGTQFYYKQSTANGDVLWADKYTPDLNDLQVYWLTAGVGGVLWPDRFVRYSLVWPADLAQYSHYLRTAVTNQAEAALTAVPLDPAEAPSLDYQDPLDQIRGFLPANDAFYTWLTPSEPAHRALLRFNANGNVRFERVFSWLDTAIENTSLLANSVATNLTAVAAYFNYPSAYANYTNYLANLAAYTSYTNYLANLAAYTSYTNYLANLAAYNNYTNYVAYTNLLSAYNNYVSYRNYLADPSRGVNGVWHLVIESPDAACSISSWAVDVVSQPAGGGALLTNEFVASGFSAAAGQGNFGADTVAGITNAVTAVQLKVNRINDSNPAGLMMALYNPANSLAYPIEQVEAANAAVNVNLIFNDSAATMLMYSFVSGTYQLQSAAQGGTLASLLSPVVSPPAQPYVTNAPAFVATPAQPYVTSLPPLPVPLVTNLPSAPVLVVPNPPAFVAYPTPVLSPWTNSFTTPGVVTGTVNVGDRLVAPPGEVGSTNGSSYLAGYINQTNGNSFDYLAYLDPFAHGFTAANQGAIIPVNAIPGNNLLQVWWFRPNGADNAAGFETVYWPEVIGNYTLQWPAQPTNQIIMAANVGTGTLDPDVAEGIIYTQNDPTLPGYNPNEEHALMTGGAAYALCDDLNVTNGDNAALPFNGYSSAPFVLIHYVADADGRPAMALYQVRREAPELGILFDYPVPAGSKLQPPMPLPFLPAPLVGTNNLNTISTNYGDWPANWSASDASGPYGSYPSFTMQDRQHNFWVYRGPHAGLPALQVGQYDTNTGLVDLPLPAATALVSNAFTYYLHASRAATTLFITNTTPLPPGLTLAGPLEGDTNGLVLTGTPTSLWSNTITIVVTDVADNFLAVTNQLVVNVVTNGTPYALGPLAVTSTNQYSQATITYSNRPPYLAQPPTPTNSFTMRFYYVTQAGFAWPALGNQTNWPPPGSIVPYLLPITNGATGMGFSGDPTTTNTHSLQIVYRPYWPEVDASGGYIPSLEIAQTITTATSANGLTAVRNQDSVQVLYQESIATNLLANDPANPSPTAVRGSASVTLFDPTVNKKSALTLATPTASGLPASVVADRSQGLVYFPNLPPNLISRFWFDPNGNQLVLTGQFNTDDPAKPYLLLNVLGAADLAAVNGLCNGNDPNYASWIQAVAGLKVNLYTEDTLNTYGLYQIDTNLTVNFSGTQVVTVNSPDSLVDSYALSAMGPGEGYITYMVGNSQNPAYAADVVSMQVARVLPPLWPGALVAVNVANASPLSQSFTVQHTADLAGDTADYEYDWRIVQPVNGIVPQYGSQQQINWPSADNSGPLFTLGATGVQGLGDNYISVRYRCTNSLANPAVTNWSRFTDPVLAPGWISRVLEAVNPFNQTTSDFYDNPVNTTASIISEAGARWTGNVPLNKASLTNSGLIALYQTVLNVGKSLSIESAPPINNGPANDALLLAAGYLNDLYMTLGNDAWANSLNPTIGIGTADQTFGPIATSQFVFEGQEPTLLAQNLAFLRGRDDSLSPGVYSYPVYNHLYWNFTFGIAAGAVIYSEYYDITDLNSDGVVNAADAAILYPQGHGDAYGHYLTALTGYYELLLNPYFDWVPHSEAVSVLGATVQINYQDERKFAASAAAVARAGRQIFDLEWRQDYQPGTAGGWSYFATNYTGQFSYTNLAQQPQAVTRYWGMDHWAARVGQGAYLNWVVGNAILPPLDTDPTHQGIEKVDRTTVPELAELPATATALENDLDNANAGFTPLGLSQNSIPFDINPQQVTGANPQTHFEQIYTRAVQALNNAVVAFDAAQNVTQELRQDQSSADAYAASVTAQELAFNNQLIEIYGTPYPNDIGPGGFYPQGYTGPDLQDYMYVDATDTNLYGGYIPDPTLASTNYVFIGSLPADWTYNYDDFSFYTNVLVEPTDTQTASTPANATNYYPYVLGPDGYVKPASWTSERLTQGSIQTAITTMNEAQDRLRMALATALFDKQNLDRAFQLFQAQTLINSNILNEGGQITADNKQINDIQTGYNIADAWFSTAEGTMADTLTSVGNVDGATDLDAAGEAAIVSISASAVDVLTRAADATFVTVAQSVIKNLQEDALNLAQEMAANGSTLNQQNAVTALEAQFQTYANDLTTISQDQQALTDAQTAVRQQLSAGLALQATRESFRQRAAALVQGYRTDDAAFLVFQNEELGRYTTLFNLAAQYAYMAANAYDYETGLLDPANPAAKSFANQILSSCALGVIQDGQPQVSGTATGDPGLANALAEMYADWSVLKGRLGFNNPDGYGTAVSLRTENYRIKPDATGDNNWQMVLQQGFKQDLLADSDVKQHCLQLDDGTGAAVPGLELTFSTTITDGENLFGQPLGPGDHDFSSSSFATKIFSVGVCFDGYVGMDNPAASGGVTPPDPTLDPNALAATPYVYLIPCGQDSMRSPPLGDTSTIRSWNVNDVAIPLPFNISASSFSSEPFYSSSDSLTEPLFAVRKQQAFRPVSTTEVFSPGIYGANGALAPSQYTNQRLIGRSVWNSQWKLVIPGKNLLADPNQGLARFIHSVKDVHLYFLTYSYAGN